MPVFHCNYVLTATLLFLLQSPAPGQGLTKAEVAKIGKAATAFVEVKSRNSSGSAFCVHPSGLFITNEHVVRNAGEINLVLNAGQKDQKVMKAKVIRSDQRLDLALLQAEGQKDLASLSLGSVDKLAELVEVVACGFPFGQSLGSGKEYPAISINFGSVTSLRQKDGALHRIQLDVELNPGNSGGPVLDMDGKVVGVVVAGVKGARVNFAIPVSHVSQFVEKPEIQFVPPVLNRSTVGRPVLFRARAISILPSPRLPELELVLRSGKEKKHRYKMELVDGTYSVKAVAIARPEEHSALRIKLDYSDGSVNGSLEDRSFKIGDKELKLSAVRHLHFREKPSVVLTDGKVLEGAISGLEAVPVQLGGEKTTLNVLKATEAQLTSPVNVASVLCMIIATQAGKEVGRLSRLIVNEDAAVKVYLSDMQEFDVKNGPWGFGKNGRMGDDQVARRVGQAISKFMIKGTESSKGLGMHPPDSGYTSVKYRLGKNVLVLEASVALMDGASGGNPAIFELLGDGISLWQSKEVQAPGQIEECSIDVTGVDVLELRVHAKGSCSGMATAWVEPYVWRALHALPE